MPEQEPKVQKFNILYLILGFWALVMLYDYFAVQKNVTVIPYSEFLSHVEAGNVDDVTLAETQVRGVFKRPPKESVKNFSTVRIEDPDLAARLTKQGVTFRGVVENTFWRSMLAWVVPILLMFVLWRYLFGKLSQSPGAGFLPLGKAKAKIYVEKDLKVSFEDVAGVDEAKEELREVVEFLKTPAKFSILGGRIPKGVLLIGPPGTGKTLLAKAVAGEAKVVFFSINGSEFVEMFVGLGAARVRDLFEQARQHAPCIVFIDELDALGKSRALGPAGLSMNDEKEQTLNQFLAEVDGFDSSQGVVLLGATNRPEILDPALLRSGRFDRQVLVDKADKVGREQILRVHVKTIKLDQSVDLAAVAGLTTGFSGADLANLVNEAALAATRRNAEAVFLEDFTVAIERIIAGLEHKKRLINAEEKRRVAHHEMGHATVALSIKSGDRVHKVSIIPRGVGALGYTIQRPLEDRYLMDRQELLGKIAVLLGGRAAESRYFSEISTGIHDDLSKASDIARSMVTQYGMSEKLGLLAYEKSYVTFLKGQMDYQRQEYSEATARIIDEEAERVLEQGYALARQALEAHTKFFEAAVNELLVKETLTEDDIQRLWKQYAHVGRTAA